LPQPKRFAPWQALETPVPETAPDALARTVTEIAGVPVPPHVRAERVEGGYRLTLTTAAGVRRGLIVGGERPLAATVRYVLAELCRAEG
jgi:hypothetical protein